MMIPSIGWQLQIITAATKAPGAGDEFRCKPRLYLIIDRENYIDAKTPKTDVFGYIEYDTGARYEGRARWLVHYYPLDARDLPSQYEESYYSTMREILSAGEKCEPRDTARGAFDRLVDVAACELTIKGAELDGLRAVGIELLKPTTDLTERYQRRIQRAPARVAS